MDADNARVKAHCEDGGIAAVIENGELVIYKGKWKTIVEKVVNIPLTVGGKATCMIKNVMPAALAAMLQGISVDVIREALRSFIPSPSQTPGRMNMFRFRDFEVMIDYAHNPDGFLQLQQFMNAVDSPWKVGVLSATGDRRDEDIVNIGKLAAEIFDEIIIKHDDDLRGRTQQSITELLIKGISSVKDMALKVISDERDAIGHALQTASPGSFVVICADKIQRSIAQVEALQQAEKQQPETIMQMPKMMVAKTA